MKYPKFTGIKPHVSEILIQQWCTVITSPPAGVQSIAIGVSVCLSVLKKLHVQTMPRNFLLHVICGRRSTLLRRQYNTLCTSGFADDVTFSHNRISGAESIVEFAGWQHRGEVCYTQLPY